MSMPTRLAHLVTGAAEPVRLARFRAQALGWEVVDEELMSLGFPVIEYYRALAELPGRFRALIAESKGGEIR